MRRPSPRPALAGLVLVLVAALAGCRSGRQASSPALLAQPGWGRTFAPEEARIQARAVPASARPCVPPVRLFRPGWGRDR